MGGVPAADVFGARLRLWGSVGAPEKLLRSGLVFAPSNGGGGRVDSILEAGLEFDVLAMVVGGVEVRK